MTKCKGCGAELQTSDPKAPGYTPKEGAEYCQRCFRLIHYDDLTVSMRKGIDPEEIMKKIAEMDCQILWVIDLFDFEAGILPGLNRFLADKDIILAANKRDLLPETLSPDKIARFVFSRLKEEGIRIRSLVLTSREDPDSIEELREVLHENSDGRPVAVIGRANSGKSTLLNRLLGKETLTMSRYPGTTLDFNTMEADGLTFVDTPGIEISHSMLMETEEKVLKDIIPYRHIKPQIFQLRGDQSFALGGLARIDLAGCDHASCVFYLSDRLNVHRSKIENADALWKNHYGELLRPVALDAKFRTYSIHKELTKMDIVIDGLGWACVSGTMKTVTVQVPQNVRVTFRKAMI
jgi:ribosome biogenesis GTPase YqeH